MRQCDTRFSNVRSDLYYVPIYVQVYTYESSAYYVLVHGASGKVVGQRPYGLGALGAASASAFRAVGAFLGLGEK